MQRYTVDAFINFHQFGDPFADVAMLPDSNGEFVRYEDAKENGAIWTRCDDGLPPIGAKVLVTDGEEVGISSVFLGAQINGRWLLPSDPRLEELGELMWSRYCNVTHWMRLPDLPNAKDKPAGQ